MPELSSQHVRSAITTKRRNRGWNFNLTRIVWVLEAIPRMTPGPSRGGGVPGVTTPGPGPKGGPG